MQKAPRRLYGYLMSPLVTIGDTTLGQLLAYHHSFHISVGHDNALGSGAALEGLGALPELPEQPLSPVRDSQDPSRPNMASVALPTIDHTTSMQALCKTVGLPSSHNLAEAFLLLSLKGYLALIVV